MDGVQAVWLNRSGTAIAVVWSEVPNGERIDALRALLQKKHLSPHRTLSPQRLSGDEHRNAMASFLSGCMWYQSNELDLLSEEEYRVISSRLVVRLQSRVSVASRQAKVLEQAFFETLKHKQNLTRGDGTGTAADHILRERLLQVGRRYLDERGMEALRQVIAQGLGPQQGER